MDSLKKNPLLLTIVVATILIIAAPFLSSSVEHFENKVAAKFICAYRSEKACEGVYRASAGLKTERDIARIAGRRLCDDGRADVCASLGQIDQQEHLTAAAITAFDQACASGQATACNEWLIGLSAEGRLPEALAGATALCQNSLSAAQAAETKSPETARSDTDQYCYLAGVIAKQTKSKATLPTMEWAFYQGCFRQRTAEACVELGLHELRHKKQVAAFQAMRKGCALGLQVACDNVSHLEKAHASKAETLATIINEHRKYRVEFDRLRSGHLPAAHLAQAKVNMQTVLGRLGDRYRAYSGGTNEDAIQVRNLFADEVAAETTALRSNQPNGYAQALAAQRKADAAFSRLPASLR